MTKKQDGGPAFPVPEAANLNDQEGMTLRQYAAIQLRVPNSGTDWLDDMIRQARRDDAAEKAMAGDWAAGNAGNVSFDEDTRRYYRMADAMLRAREAK